MSKVVIFKTTGLYDTLYAYGVLSLWFWRNCVRWYWGNCWFSWKREGKGRKLRWTGDSCNLIELAYGLFDFRQINDGEVDLSDVMEVFQINLSRNFRRFTEIKRRKSISKTRFLDQMKAAVEKRIEDGDAYVPMSMR